MKREDIKHLVLWNHVILKIIGKKEMKEVDMITKQWKLNQHQDLMIGNLVKIPNKQPKVKPGIGMEML